MTFDPNSRYQDRIESSASAYNNPYRNDFDAAKGYGRLRHVEQGRLVDRYESKNEKYERALLDKFRLNEFKVSGESFALVFQIGKMVLLVIFMPPIVIFYTVPKWLFQQLAPVFDKGLEGAIQGMQKMWTAVMTWTQDLWKLSLSLIQKMNKSKKPLKKSRQGEHVYQSVLKEMKANFANAKAWMAQSFENGMSKIKQGFSWVQRGVNYQLIRLSRSLSSAVSIFKKGLERGKEFIHAIYVPLKRGLRAFKEFNENALAALKKAANFIKPKWEARKEKIKESFKELFVKVGQAATTAKTVFTEVKRQLEINLFVPLKNYAMAAHSVIAKPLEAVRAGLAAMGLVIKHQVEIKLQTWLNFGAAMLEKGFTLGGRVFLYAKSKWNDLLRQGKEAFQRSWKPFSAAAKMVASWTLALMQRKLGRWAHLWQALVRFLKRLVASALKFLKELPGRIHHAAIVSAKTSVALAKKTWRGTKFASLWLKVFLKYNTQQVWAWVNNK